ncbi:hypothetical protein H4I95_00155 [Botrytis cinerea]
MKLPSQDGSLIGLEQRKNTEPRERCSDTTNQPEKHVGDQDVGSLWMKTGDDGISVPGRASVNENSQSCDCEAELFQGADLQVSVLQQDQGWSPHCCFKDPRKIKVGAVSEVIVLYTPAFALKPCARLWLPKTAR